MGKKNKNNRIKIDSMIEPAEVVEIVQDARNLINFYDDECYEHEGLPVVAAEMLEKKLDLLSLDMTINNGHVIIKGMKGFEAIDGSFYPNTTGEKPKVLRNDGKDYETTVGITFPNELSANVVMGIGTIVKKRVYSGSEVSKFVNPLQVDRTVNEVINQAKPYLNDVMIKEFTKKTYMEYLNWAKKKTKNPTIIVDGIKFCNYDFVALEKIEKNYKIAFIDAKPKREGLKLYYKETENTQNGLQITNRTGDVLVKETDRDTMGRFSYNACGKILHRTNDKKFTNDLNPGTAAMMKKMINESYYTTKKKY